MAAPVDTLTIIIDIEQVKFLSRNMTHKKFTYIHLKEKYLGCFLLFPTLYKRYVPFSGNMADDQFIAEDQ